MSMNNCLTISTLIIMFVKSGLTRAELKNKKLLQGYIQQADSRTIPLACRTYSSWFNERILLCLLRNSLNPVSKSYTKKRREMVSVSVDRWRDPSIPKCCSGGDDLLEFLVNYQQRLWDKRVIRSKPKWLRVRFEKSSSILRRQASKNYPAEQA